MKFRADFVTNSSSSSFINVGYFSKDLINYLYELIQEGYIYRELPDCEVLADNYEDAVVNSLSFIPNKRNAIGLKEKIGFQISVQGDWHYGFDPAVDGLMKFINLEHASEEKAKEIKNKIIELITLAKKQDKIFEDTSIYSTDASDFQEFYDERDYDRTLYNITSRGYIESCKDPNSSELIFYGPAALIKARAFAKMKSLKTVWSIQKGIRKIGAYAFADCENLIEVKGILFCKLGKGAFKNCKNLQKFELEKCSLNKGAIEERTFENCESLTELKVTFGNRSISRLAFKGCRSLKKIWISPTVREIADDAFDGCPNLTIHSRANTYVQEYAQKKNIRFCVDDQDDFHYPIYWIDNGKRMLEAWFEGGEVSEPVIPKKVVEIGPKAFAECHFSKIVLPTRVHVIDEMAFINCGKLEEIQLGVSTTFVGAAAFQGCTQLKKIVLPDGIETIKKDTFKNCRCLCSVVAKGVKTIEDFAFQGCENLISLELSDGIVSVGKDVFSGCGKYEFNIQ